LDNFSRKVGKAKRTVRVGMPVIKYTLQYPPLVWKMDFDMYAHAIGFHLWPNDRPQAVLGAPLVEIGCPRWSNVKIFASVDTRMTALSNLSFNSFG
jgi:hypothetical protein